MDDTTPPLTFIYGSTDSRDINRIPRARYHVFPFNTTTGTYSKVGETNSTKISLSSFKRLNALNASA